MAWIWTSPTELVQYDLSEVCSRCEEPLSLATKLKVMPWNHVVHENCIPSHIKPLGDMIDLTENCYLCKKELSESTILKEMPCCCRLFHADCLRKWFDLSFLCPWPSCFGSCMMQNPMATSGIAMPYKLFY
ncbi:hypothetical protein SLA2020_001090 [Shorea laevis]